MILSFIIPVYNTALYLERCVLSIISQLGTETASYEIIIVNDGSTDNSHEIIHALAKAYPDLIVVVEHENKGLGAARNSGQKVSRGKYLFFVDSDDYINEGSLKTLLSAAESSNDDILEFGVIALDKKQKPKYLKRGIPNVPISGDEYLLKYIVVGGVWSYIYRSDFLSAHNLWMPEGIYHEDELFLTRALLFATSICLVNTFVYVYEQREGSITKSRNKKIIEKRIDDSLFTLNEFLLLEKSNSLTTSQSQGLNRKIKLFSHDIVIVLIRLRVPKKIIYSTIEKMKSFGLFPLPKVKGSWKHSIFRILTCNKYFVWLLSKSFTVRKFLA